MSYPFFHHSILSEAMLFMITATVLFVLGPLAAPLMGQPVNFTCDFEEGKLRGWKTEGTAFDNQPTFRDNPTARHKGQPSDHQGNWWIGTFENYQGKPGQDPGNAQGDEPTGALTSNRFTIPKGKLSFLIGGGSHYATRVELMVIDDPIEQMTRSVLHTTGKNTETMSRVTWDLTPFEGKRGCIRIVDGSSGDWGHINVDDFRFEDTSSLFGKFRGIITPKHSPKNQVKQNISVSLSADKHRIQANEDVVLKARSNASNQNPEYFFEFGDGQSSGWVGADHIRHSYADPKTYHARVQVRLKRETATSRYVTIVVKKKGIVKPPDGGGEAAGSSNNSIPPDPRKWPDWVKMLLSAGAAAIIVYGIMRIRNHWISKDKVTIKSNSQPDKRVHIIEFAEPSGLYPEVSVRPVLDKGEQDINIGDLLIRS